MKALKILLVRWEDISEHGGWFPCDGQEENHVDTAKCTEVGIKVKETKTALYLAKLYGHDPHGGAQWGSLTAIPKGCIRSIEVLRTLKAKAPKVVSPEEK